MISWQFSNFSFQDQLCILLYCLLYCPAPTAGGKLWVRWRILNIFLNKFWVFFLFARCKQKILVLTYWAVCPSQAENFEYFVHCWWTIFRICVSRMGWTVYSYTLTGFCKLKKSRWSLPPKSGLFQKWGEWGNTFFRSKNYLYAAAVTIQNNPIYGMLLSGI